MSEHPIFRPGVDWRLEITDDDEAAIIEVLCRQTAEKIAEMERALARKIACFPALRRAVPVVHIAEEQGTFAATILRDQHQIARLLAKHRPELVEE